MGRRHLGSAASRQPATAAARAAAAAGPAAAAANATASQVSALWAREGRAPQQGLPGTQGRPLSRSLPGGALLHRATLPALRLFGMPWRLTFLRPPLCSLPLGSWDNPIVVAALPYNGVNRTVRAALLCHAVLVTSPLCMLCAAARAPSPRRQAQAAGTASPRP